MIKTVFWTEAMNQNKNTLFVLLNFENRENPKSFHPIRHTSELPSKVTIKGKPKYIKQIYENKTKIRVEQLNKWNYLHILYAVETTRPRSR